jgi:hypothetical protein
LFLSMIANADCINAVNFVMILNYLLKSLGFVSYIALIFNFFLNSTKFIC